MTKRTFPATRNARGCGPACLGLVLGALTPSFAWADTGALLATCSELAVVNVEVGADSIVKIRNTEARETAPVKLIVIAGGDGDGKHKPARIFSDTPYLVYDEASWEKDKSVVAGSGVFSLDLAHSMLRLAEPVAGASANFRRFECETRPATPDELPPAAKTVGIGVEPASG